MKRALIILMVVLLLPALCAAESAYSPRTGMTMSEFIASYNNLPASLNSPYRPLVMPMQWTEFQGSNVAWFYPATDSDVALLLLTNDPKGKTLDSGLDQLQVYNPDVKYFPSFIAIGTRCAQLFAMDLFTMSSTPHAITSVLNYYYENAIESGRMATWGLNMDTGAFIGYFQQDGYGYTFDIFFSGEATGSLDDFGDMDDLENAE